jgi:hypothetical protein
MHAQVEQVLVNTVKAYTHTHSTMRCLPCDVPDARVYYDLVIINFDTKGLAENRGSLGRVPANENMSRNGCLYLDSCAVSRSPVIN